MPDRIAVYSHDYCMACAPVLALLKRTGVDYAYVDVVKDDAGRDELQRINGGRTIAPTLAFPDGSTMTDPDLPTLRGKLNESGYSTSPVSRALRRLRSVFAAR